LNLSMAAIMANTQPFALLDRGHCAQKSHECLALTGHTRKARLQ
jgi:hypothetical protein